MLTPLEKELLEACREALKSVTDPYYFDGHAGGPRDTMRRRQKFREMLRAAIARAELRAFTEPTHVQLASLGTGGQPPGLDD